MMRHIDEIKLLKREIGRYRKKVADQQKEIQRMKEREQSNMEGLKEMTQFCNALIIQTALSYGRREEEEGEVLGWRLELPALDVRALGEKYERRSRRDAESNTLVIGVLPREDA